MSGAKKRCDMPNARYVREKMHVAIISLCGEGSYDRRLANATISALMRLNANDLSGELSKKLEYILAWTKENMENGSIRRIPDEIESKRLMENMLDIFAELSQISTSF